jgi:pimeloyl-ACP methyl ester carboxylesterase
MIFQPSDRLWPRSDQQGMQEVWITHPHRVEADQEGTSHEARLHALWLDGQRADAPVLLYLHGARWNVSGSTARMRRMQSLGFAVLAVDYQGFGQSSKGLPSEASARADAQAAWDWLASQYPDRPRFIFGHSLGGAIAVDLATRVPDVRGLIVEGTFTRIADVARTFKWGWLPFQPFITQPFDSVDKVPQLKAPLLVVHGSADQLIPSNLGQRLYEAAPRPSAGCWWTVPPTTTRGPWAWPSTAWHCSSCGHPSWARGTAPPPTKAGTGTEPGPGACRSRPPGKHDRPVAPHPDRRAERPGSAPLHCSLLDTLASGVWQGEIGAGICVRSGLARWARLLRTQMTGPAPRAAARPAAQPCAI